MDVNGGLVIEDLRVDFGAHPVFAGLSLAVGPGVTWLRGPNGAGKTTLLRVVAGALEPQRGSLRIAGVCRARDPYGYRQRCFLAGGEVPDLPWLTVPEYLELHVGLYGPATAQALAGHRAALALPVGGAQRLTALSLGQRQKLQLAIGLSVPTPLLLLDEPFNALDEAAIAYLRAHLRRASVERQRTILLTSHADPDLPGIGEARLVPGAAGAAIHQRPA
jgi:ABC-type multidrug transport system ATPase subunit